ncbi:MAG: hypothetical protein IKP51_09565 [Treponema sp.]|nr:hypothetical protein [Treponema sp.]
MQHKLLSFLCAMAAIVLLSLSSCSGIASPSEPKAEAQHTEQTFTLRGTICMAEASAVPNEVITSPNTSSRNAIPDLSIFTGLTYTVTARQNSTTVSTTSPDGHSYTFENLTAGTWTVTAYARNGSGNLVMQSASKSINLSKTSPEVTASLPLSPAGGSGNIEIGIGWSSETGITCCKYTSDIPGLASGTITGTPTLPNISASNIPAGTYALTLSFYTSEENATKSVPLYKCTEYVAVYPGLTTSTWTKNSAHISPERNFLITKDCVETFVYRKIYVSGSGSDTSGTGTSERPFASIQKAMVRLNEVAPYDDTSESIAQDQPWELHVSGCPALPESITGGSLIDVTSSIHYLKIVGDGSGATIDANKKGRVLNVGAGSYVSIENVTLKNGSSSFGGGVYVASGGNFTMESGSICGNTVTSSGGGVYTESSSTFNFSGGRIYANTAATSGGGIFCAGSLCMSGSAEVGNIEKNVSPTAENVTDQGGNKAKDGGGIFISSGASVLIGYTAAGSIDPDFDGGIGFNYAERYGGGIDNRDNGTKIAGGKVSCNCNENGLLGSGIHAQESMTLLEDAYIPAGSDGKNDIWLDGGSSKINIEGTLSRHNAADKIQLALSQDPYHVRTQVLQADTDDLLSSERTKFMATGATADSELLYVGTDGKLFSPICFNNGSYGTTLEQVTHEGKTYDVVRYSYMNYDELTMSLENPYGSWLATTTTIDGGSPISGSIDGMALDDGYHSITTTFTKSGGATESGTKLVCVKTKPVKVQISGQLRGWYRVSPEQRPCPQQTFHLQAGNPDNEYPEERSFTLTYGDDNGYGDGDHARNYYWWTPDASNYVWLTSKYSTFYFWADQAYDYVTHNYMGKFLKDCDATTRTLEGLKANPSFDSGDRDGAGNANGDAWDRSRVWITVSLSDSTSP